jgi:hypothetical protein
MQYHITLLSILEPIVADESRTSHNDLIMDSTPQELAANSIASLETILRLYYLRHGFDSFDIMLGQFLMIVGFASIKDLSRVSALERNSKLSTVILCAKGLREQGRNYYLCEAVFRMVRDAMDPSDVSILRESTKIEEEEERKELMARHINSDWPITTVSVAQDPEDHRLDNLIHATERLTVEESDTTDSLPRTPGPA